MNFETQGYQDFLALPYIIHNGRKLMRVRGAEAVPGAPPAAAPGQPPASGEAPAPSSAPTTGFNWGLFPDVAEEARPQLEPHLKNVQAHVTRLEQQYAPFKPFLDAGMDAETASGILGFAQRYEQSPLEVWSDMARQLQENGVLHEDADVDAIIAAAQGDFGEEVPPPADPNAEPESELARQVRELQARLDARDQEQQTRIQQQEQQRRQAALTHQLNWAKGQLKEAGLPEDIISDRDLAARLIVHKGDMQAVVQSLVSQQEAIVNHFTKNNSTRKPGDLEIDNVPKSTNPRPSGRTDSWSKARDGAAQRMAQMDRAQAADGG